MVLLDDPDARHTRLLHAQSARPCRRRLPVGADHAGYYSTAPLEATLAELVDFNLISKGKPRLTVGAAHVRTSQMTYFDSRCCKLDLKHIMASGALPPAFPAARVNGELYWDGGILMRLARTAPMPVTSSRRSALPRSYRTPFPEGAHRLFGVDWSNAPYH